MEKSLSFSSKNNDSSFFKNEIITKLIPWLLPFISFVIFCIFIIIRTEATLDSDLSSELVLAKLLSEERSIISKSWYYSTELRVLNTQLIFTPLFWLFDSWKTVRIIGTILLNVIYIASFIFFCYSANLKKYTPYLTALLILPFAYEPVAFITKGCYYIPHIAISFVTLGISFKLAKCKNKNGRIILYGILGILSLLAGMGGLRQLQILYIPFFISTLILWHITKEKPNLYIGLAAIVCFMTGFIGYLINSKILYDLYSFQKWDVSYSTPSLENFWTCFTGLFSFWGYSIGKVFSSASVFNFVSFFAWFLTAISIIHTFKNKTASTEDKHICLFFLVNIIVFVSLYCITNMAYSNRYNLPIVIFIIPILAIGLKNIAWEKLYKHVSFGIFGCCLLYCCLYNCIAWFENDNNANHRAVTQFLLTNEYTFGFATFWNSNVITELSNGEIDMYTWDSPEGVNNIYNRYRWLQLKSHDDYIPEGKFFVLLNEPEYQNSIAFNKLKTDNIIFRDCGYVIFGFNNLSEFNTFNYVFKDNYCLINGNDENDIRTIFSGGISYGPYISMIKGTYKVTIKGMGLNNDGVFCDCSYNMGKSFMNITALSHTAEEIIYTFNLTEKTDGLEFRITNNSPNNISISELKVEMVNE